MDFKLKAENLLAALDEVTPGNMVKTAEEFIHDLWHQSKHDKDDCQTCTQALLRLVKQDVAPRAKDES